MRTRSAGWRFLGSVILAVAIGSTAYGADEPLIAVSAGSLEPRRLEVHIGETVRWRAEGGARVRIELDPHRGAHEVVSRATEIGAVFLRAGEHWYSASIVGSRGAPTRGVIVVRPADVSKELPDVRTWQQRATLRRAVRAPAG